MKHTIENLFTKSPRLLLIDDTPQDLEQMVEWLFDPDTPLYQASNGEQAKKILSKKKVDVVITDWQLPGLSGLELIKELRGIQFEGPLLICTGMMLSPEHLETAFEAGASDYLRKPLNAVELKARLNNSLQLFAQNKVLKQTNRSQTRFINYLSEHLGQDLQYLAQSHDIDPKMLVTHQSLNQTFHQAMLWGRYRFSLQHVHLTQFAFKLLSQDLEMHFKDHAHRLFFRGRDVSLNSEPAILQKVLTQLLENALEYTSGPITIKAQQREEHIRVSVQNSGQDLSEGQLSRLMHGQGTGLGLEICHDLLALLGSPLQAKHLRNGDSCFFFDLVQS